MQRRHMLSLAALLAPAALLPAPALAAPGRPRGGNGLLLRNVRGAAGLVDPGTLAGRFRGDVLIQSLSINEATRQLSVQGLLTGIVKTPGGRARRITNQAFTATATLSGETGDDASAASRAQAQAVCQILNLDIGRITLDVLGLVIDLAPVDLDVFARSGPGRLLGNLLCGLVGLLDNPLSLIGDILAIIRQINDLLSGNRIVA
jgi:hypothetical protein